MQNLPAKLPSEISATSEHQTYPLTLPGMSLQPPTPLPKITRLQKRILITKMVFSGVSLLGAFVMGAFGYLGVAALAFTTALGFSSVALLGCRYTSEMNQKLLPVKGKEKE